MKILLASQVCLKGQACTEHPVQGKAQGRDLINKCQRLPWPHFSHPVVPPGNGLSPVSDGLGVAARRVAAGIIWECVWGGFVNQSTT